MMILVSQRRVYVPEAQYCAPEAYSQYYVNCGRIEGKTRIEGRLHVKLAPLPADMYKKIEPVLRKAGFVGGIECSDIEFKDESASSDRMLRVGLVVAGKDGFSYRDILRERQGMRFTAGDE